MRSNNTFYKKVLIVGIVICISYNLPAVDTANPKATPEAKALLDLYYRISGK